MSLVLLALGGVCLLSVVVLWLDNPVIPSYKTRQGYRLLSFFLLVLVLLLAFKAQAYRLELRMCYSQCP